MLLENVLILILKRLYQKSFIIAFNLAHTPFYSPSLSAKEGIYIITIIRMQAH